MTDESSPFEDPEFLEMLKRSGVTHRPGLAAELMEDIGPLLAADGFDMDNLAEDVDMDDLNAAMSRAVERRNMELLTPVGDERVRTITTLREIAVAFNGGQVAQVGEILEKLRPDPTKRRPSFGQLTGVALETLDTWYTAEGLRSAVATVPVRDIPPAAKTVASDLEALARKARAFQSIDSLLGSHNGGVVAEAGAYLVAATVTAVAVYRSEPFEQILDELLPEEGASTAFTSRLAFGFAATEQLAARQYLNQFGEWLIDNEIEAGTDPEDLEIFETIVDAAIEAGLDPHDPDDFVNVIGLVLPLEDAATVDWSLSVLHDYVHFRMQTDDDAQAWQEPHEMISEDTAGLQDVPPELQAALQNIEEISEEDRLAAVMSTPLITGVDTLMEWIGTSQPVTATGLPKRADIATVAAMIGINAEGVAKLPALDDTEERLAALDLTQPVRSQRRQTVQSAKDVSELLAWWTTLEAQSVIELTTTRVQHGLAADDLTGSQLENLQPAEMFIMGYIREYLVEHIFGHPMGAPAAAHMITQLLGSVLQEDEQTETVDSNGLGANWILEAQYLRSFELLGLIEIHDAKPSIPEALRPAVVFGLMLVLADLSSPDEL